jgi:hypothetical protein
VGTLPGFCGFAWATALSRRQETAALVLQPGHEGRIPRRTTGPGPQTQPLGHLFIVPLPHRWPVPGHPWHDVTLSKTHPLAIRNTGEASPHSHIPVIVLRAWPRLKAGLAHRSGMGYATMGAFFGPFIGVGMSLVAVKYAPVGVAATIMAIVPVLIIPFVIVLYRERISPRAILGAVLAVAGVALLFV